MQFIQIFVGDFFMGLGFRYYADCLAAELQYLIRRGQKLSFLNLSFIVMTLSGESNLFSNWCFLDAVTFHGFSKISRIF